MSHVALFAKLEDQLLNELSTSTPELYNAVKTIFTNYKLSEMSTDCMVAEFYAVLNGAFSTLLEAIRDMGYNIEGIQREGMRARSFQYLNQHIVSFPVLSKYDLGAFFGATTGCGVCSMELGSQHRRVVKAGAPRCAGCSPRAGCVQGCSFRCAAKVQGTTWARWRGSVPRERCD